LKGFDIFQNPLLDHEFSSDEVLHETNTDLKSSTNLRQLINYEALVESIQRSIVIVVEVIYSIFASCFSHETDEVLIYRIHLSSSQVFANALALHRAWDLRKKNRKKYWNRGDNKP